MKAAENLRRELFPEEDDYYWDSILDNKERSRGVNPMCEDYQLKVEQKRKTLGVSPLASNGMAADNSSLNLCIEEVKARSRNETTDKTDLIKKYLDIQNQENEANKKRIEQRSAYIENIDRENPDTWTDVMINNAYDLYCFVEMWEMDPRMPFDEFKDELKNNREFCKENAPRNGMDSKDWSIS